jgi:S1-C subfamily serine protease
MGSDSSGIPDREVIERAMPAVVQIVALRQQFLGNLSPAWTGSGTIVDPSGLILTNCHVVNPRAMGMPAPPADRLAVAITQRSDEPPALTYFAEIVVQSPALDLAVLRIVAGLDGKPAGKLSLPAIPVGDSDKLELGDTLSIFGYPGIGGETVTFTSGSVAGFSKEQGVRDRRAWIKTDATIAGGNSGGTGLNHDGELVGIPTQAAAGTGITPVDARPVVDTTGDGRVDHRDTPMAVGGFINGLRPVKLAKPLLAKAGMRVSGAGAAEAVPMTPAPQPQPRRRSRKASGPEFSNLVFSTQVTRDGRPINPAAVLTSGQKEVYATFEYDGMRNGMAVTQVWAKDGETIASEETKWKDGPRGRKTLSLGNPKGLPDGQYHLVIAVGKQVVVEGEVILGRRVEDTDTQVSGVVVDRSTGRGIPNALVIALRPGVQVRDFARKQRKDMAYTSTRTDAQGRFVFPQQLPKGEAYGLVVASEGYRDLGIESALRIGSGAPEHARLNPISLVPD